MRAKRGQWGERFQGGLVFKAHRLCASLDSMLESNKEEVGGGATHVEALEDHLPELGVRIYIYIYGYIWIYPLCGETLEPLARFLRKLPKDSNLAENGFPGLIINQEFLGSFSTDKSICSA